jgi:short-subunit dehydrogenase
MTLQENDLSGKICCITGGTSGIGKETPLALARMGATIVLPARNLELAETVKKEIIDKTGNVISRDYPS